MKKYIIYTSFIGLNFYFIHKELSNVYPSIKRYNINTDKYEILHSYCIFGPKNKVIRDVKKFCDIIQHVSSKK